MQRKLNRVGRRAPGCHRRCCLARSDSMRCGDLRREDAVILLRLRQMFGQKPGLVTASQLHFPYQAPPGDPAGDLPGRPPGDPRRDPKRVPTSKVGKFTIPLGIARKRRPPLPRIQSYSPPLGLRPAYTTTPARGRRLPIASYRSITWPLAVYPA